MASSVSKHKFQWLVGGTESTKAKELNSVMESKVFSMRVFDLDVKCNAGVFDRNEAHYYSDSDDERTGFFYELIWNDRENTPLMYTCKVRIREKEYGFPSHVSIPEWEAFVWSDNKAMPDGSHVSSSAVEPKGSAWLQHSFGFLEINFNFEFKHDAALELYSPMSVAKLALPLLEENVLSDVVVVCGDKTFNCHKFLLAGRSEVFKRMLTRPFKEAESGIVELKDCDPDVASLFIGFFYSDDVAEFAVTWELFEAAKMYDVARLQALCLRSLRKNLNVGNCGAALLATFKHDLDEFFDYAVKFSKENRSEVAKTDGWKAVEGTSELFEKLNLNSS